MVFFEGRELNYDAIDMRIVLMHDGHTNANAIARPSVHRNSNESWSQHVSGCRYLDGTMDDEYTRQANQNQVNPIRLSNTVERIEDNQEE
ncbi:hypothetical protein DPMN_052748 [Dreissena polymorpha]|uniref:Uncharacterized protein n=1 Tax=Dreissena polymorpha TaxID=45954 RepID=A0A9D4CK78_DREPO|nr:hypothetical protein DPMN_052748 [Dreissena polymorpha]